MRTIGLVGYARSGKDSVAAHLTRRHGYSRVAFADALRDALLALDPVIPTGLFTHENGAGGLWLSARYSLFLEAHGYEAAKSHPEVRGLLQRLGTEAGRQTLGEDVWIRAWQHRAAPLFPRVVATDVRFENEVDAIRAVGGLVIRVTRPGYGPINDHASERFAAEVEPDHEIVNLGTLALLAVNVEALMARLERQAV